MTRTHSSYHFVNSIAFQGVAEYRNYYDSSDNWQFAGGTQQGNVKRRIADIIQAENELDMGSSSLQVDSLHISKSNQKDDNVSHTSEYKPVSCFTFLSDENLLLKLKTWWCPEKSTSSNRLASKIGLKFTRLF